MGYKKLEFIGIYYDNIGKQNVEAIENSVLGQDITRFLDSLPNINGSCWNGTTSDLLERINIIASENNINTNSKGWPKAVNSLTRKLKTILSNIREGLGFELTITRNTTGQNKGVSSINIWKIPSPSSPSSPDQNQARNEAQNGEDISSGEYTYPHQDTISSPEKGENRAQNGGSEGSEGSEDIFRTKGGDPSFQYTCYHCDDFQTNNQDLL